MNVPDAVRTLFIKFGIASEPQVASKIRARMINELSKITREGAYKGETQSTFRLRVTSKAKFYNVAIKRIIFDPARYIDWHPTVENWVQLSLAMAARYNEPGFSAPTYTPSEKHENTFYQDRLIEHFLMRADKMREGVPPARTVAAAARLAAKHIEAGLKTGGNLIPSDASKPVIHSIKPSSLASAYSARKSASSQKQNKTGQRGTVTMPPSIAPWMDHLHADQFGQALNMTRWPEQRFYSLDQVDRVAIRASQEHLEGK